MPRPCRTILILACLLLPSTSVAEVKTYDTDILSILNTTTLTVTGRTDRGTLFGIAEIRDESNATPTLERYEVFQVTFRTTRTDIFGGPNSFVYTRTLATRAPVPGQTGTGDSEGFVQWNPLSSWTPTGGTFCKDSQEIGNPLGGPICFLVNFSSEMTIAATVNSPTYDFALWTFDAMGDFSAAPYMQRIGRDGHNLRGSNTENLVRGKLRIDIPAMSIVGFGVLGAAMVFLGLRAMRSRRDPQ